MSKRELENLGEGNEFHGTERDRRKYSAFQDTRSVYTDTQYEEQFRINTGFTQHELARDDAKCTFAPLSGIYSHRGEDNEANTGRYAFNKNKTKLCVYVEPGKIPDFVKKKIFDWYGIKAKLFDDAVLEHKSDQTLWKCTLNTIGMKYNAAPMTDKLEESGFEPSDIQRMNDTFEQIFETIKTYIFYVLCDTLDINTCHFKQHSSNFYRNYNSILQELYSSIKDESQRTLNKYNIWFLHKMDDLSPFYVHPFHVLGNIDWQRSFIDKMLQTEPGLYTKCVILRIYQRNNISISTDEMKISLENIFQHINSMQSRLINLFYLEIDKKCIELDTATERENEIKCFFSNKSYSNCDTDALCRLIQKSVTIQKAILSTTLIRCGIDEVVFGVVIEQNKKDKNEWERTLNNMIMKYKIEKISVIDEKLNEHGNDFKDQMKETLGTINITMRRYVTYMILKGFEIDKVIFDELISENIKDKYSWETTINSITIIYIEKHISVIDKKLKTPDEDVQNKIKETFGNMSETMGKYMTHMILKELEINRDDLIVYSTYLPYYSDLLYKVFQNFVADPFSNYNVLDRVIDDFTNKMLHFEPHVYLICQLTNLLRHNISEDRISYTIDMLMKGWNTEWAKRIAWDHFELHTKEAKILHLTRIFPISELLH